MVKTFMNSYPLIFNGKVYLSYTVADGNGPGKKVHTVFDVASVQDAPSLGKLERDGLFLGEIEDTSRVLTEAELQSLC